MKKLGALTMAVIFSLSSGAGALAGELTLKTPVTVRKKPKHPGLGLTVGTVAGIIIGGYVAERLTDDGGSFTVAWAAMAAGGAVAGYALAGGFRPDEYEVALDQGRARLAEARREREALNARLSLASLPGLDPDGDLLAGMLGGKTSAPGLSLAGGDTAELAHLAALH